MMQIDSFVVEIAIVDRRSTLSGDDVLNHLQLTDPVIPRIKMDQQQHR